MPKRAFTSKPVKGLGKAIDNDRRRRAEQPERKANVGVAEGQAARSVLEQSSLDEFLSAAELVQATFEAERGPVRFVQEGPRLVSSAPGVAAAASAAAEARCAAARQARVPIPWRPHWCETMGAEELALSEGEAFLEWRRSLARMEEEEGLVMTPYEKNLDFWRQLWRCVERSDLLVQILDARDPAFYRCQDLERYVEHLPAKRHLLLLNKADFLPPEIRRRWAAHFAAVGVDAVFFSALRELHRQRQLPLDSQETGAADVPMPPHGPLLDPAPDVVDCSGLLEELQSRLSSRVGEETGAGEDKCRRGVVGFVGYPNVGKSSVINALFGAKKVSMSRTPGKTKHLQTLELPDAGMTLCDCPGLVFPSVVATKAHLVVNGTVPLNELRDCVPPMQLIVDKVGLEPLFEKYGLGEGSMREGAARRGAAAAGPEEAADPTRDLLAGFAAARQHFLKFGVPDETWAARKVLRDFCTGELLHCEEPPLPSAMNEAGPKDHRGAAEPPAPLPTANAAAAPVGTEGEASDSDFSDLDAFLHGGEASDQRGGRKGAAGRKVRQGRRHLG